MLQPAASNTAEQRRRITRQFLNQNNINVLPWPSMSPDINPIEHSWDRMERDIRRQQLRFRRIQDMENALIQAWLAIPQRDVRRLYLSMRRRCTAVLDAAGGHTRY